MFNYPYYKKLAEQYKYVFCENLKTNICGFDKDTMNWWLMAYNLDGELAGDINPENTFVTTGIAINHEPHMGTVSQLLRAIYFQKMGYKTQIILADLDSCNQRATSNEYIDYSFKRYYEYVRKLGFDVEKGILRGQINHPEVMKTAFMISSVVRDEDFYEVEEDISNYYRKLDIYEGINFSVKQAILLMLADFIHPGYADDYKHIIVLSGIDEHTYVPKANDVASRLGLDISISGLFSSVIEGLNGQPKMSKSLPDSSIWANMDDSEIRDILMDMPDDYSDHHDSIIYQLMKNTWLPGAVDFHKIMFDCDNKNSAWHADKLNFVDYLSSICVF